MLAERMLAGEPLQLPHELGGEALAEIGLDAELDGLEAQLLESADLGLGEALVDEILVRLASPQGQALADGHGRGGRVGVEQRPALLQEALEAPGVELLGSSWRT